MFRRGGNDKIIIRWLGGGRRAGQGRGCVLYRAMQGGKKGNTLHYTTSSDSGTTRPECGEVLRRVGCCCVDFLQDIGRYASFSATKCRSIEAVTCEK